MWQSDWTNAPKEQKFLVLMEDGANEQVITTAFYYWETACGEVDGYDGAWWALHDLVRDCPLDEGGPPEDQGLMWAPMPELSAVTADIRS